MGWDEVGKGKGADALPTLAIKEGTPVRIRFLGAISAPQLEGTKYAKGPIQAYVHWAPQELKKAAGGPVVCIGARKGCIFHQEPLKWDGSKSNWVNVVLYEGVNKQGTAYKERKIIMFDCKNSLGESIKSQAQSLQGNPEEYDWVITRTGSGMNDTTYTPMVRENPLDGATLELTDFPDQESFADDEITSIIDPQKFNETSPQTPDEQVTWYEQLAQGEEEAEEAAPAATTGKTPPAAPAGAPKAAAGKPATRIEFGEPIQIQLPGAGSARRGRPPKAAGAAVPPAAPKAAPKAAPPAPKAAAPSPYDLACKVLDPWEKPMKDSEGLDWIAGLDPDFIESDENAEYGVTQEQIDAAKLVKAGPGKAAPKGAPPAPKAAPAPAQEEEAEEDLGELQQRLIQLTKSVPTLVNFKNNKAFLKELGDGATAVGKITDVDRLKALIALCEEGDESVAAALEDPARWLETLG